MRKLVSLLLLLSLSAIGCRKNAFPASVQPAEFDVYRAYIVHYAKEHPADESQIAIDQTASSGEFLAGDKDGTKMRQTYDECLSPKGHAAFRTLVAVPNDLQNAPNATWRTLPDGKVLPLATASSDPGASRTLITVSRVFFDANGKEAYVKIGVQQCKGVCGGASTIWHAVKETDSWKLKPTKCLWLQ